jgi:hypothetical protein
MATDSFHVPRVETTSFPLRTPGKRRDTMCGQKSKCQKPENLKGKPEECTPEQIKKCHGDVRNHPCETKSSKRQGP